MLVDKLPNEEEAPIRLLNILLDHLENPLCMTLAQTVIRCVALAQYQTLCDRVENLPASVGAVGALKIFAQDPVNKPLKMLADEKRRAAAQADAAKKAEQKTLKLLHATQREQDEKKYTMLSDNLKKQCDDLHAAKNQLLKDQKLVLYQISQANALRERDRFNTELTRVVSLFCKMPDATLLSSLLALFGNTSASICQDDIKRAKTELVHFMQAMDAEKQNPKKMRLFTWNPYAASKETQKQFAGKCVMFTPACKAYRDLNLEELKGFLVVRGS